MAGRPYIVVIGGPNGAGKTTVARAVTEQTLGVTEFVNADVIATGLSGFKPQSAAFAAGRIMLRHMRELAAARASFAFESTLASRSFAPWLESLKSTGYEVYLVYVALRSPALALARIRRRVRNGGHDVPAPVVRRRFARSLHNLFSLYLPLADRWSVYDNSGVDALLVARSIPRSPPLVLHPDVWRRLNARGTKETR